MNMFGDIAKEGYKERVLENLRVEIAKANAEYAELTSMAQSYPYASDELIARRREVLARAGGIAKCIEIVEAMND